MISVSIFKRTRRRFASPEEVARIRRLATAMSRRSIGALGLTGRDLDWLGWEVRGGGLGFWIGALTAGRAGSCFDGRGRVCCGVLRVRESGFGCGLIASSRSYCV